MTVRLTKAEQETIININRADLDDGFFSFYTSYHRDFERLCRRIGGEENLLDLKLSLDPDGAPWGWNVKVPKEFYSRVNFGIRTPRKQRSILSSETKPNRRVSGPKVGNL